MTVFFLRANMAQWIDVPAARGRRMTVLFLLANTTQWIEVPFQVEILEEIRNRRQRSQFHLQIQCGLYQITLVACYVAHCFVEFVTIALYQNNFKNSPPITPTIPRNVL